MPVSAPAYAGVHWRRYHLSYCHFSHKPRNTEAPAACETEYTKTMDSVPAHMRGAMLLKCCSVD